MELSACIVVYNGADEALRAAQTVLDCTRRHPLTLYLVDNASPDGSGQCLAKAAKDGTLHILPDVIRKEFGELADQCQWAAITGPSIAGEVAVHHDTCVVFCSEDQEYVSWVADLFRTDHYHVWTSTDFIGCEVAAAAKNIYAFGGGFAGGILDKQGKTNDR